MAWLTGWNYRKKITITGSSAGAQSNYPMVGLKVHRQTGSDSLPDIYLGDKCKINFEDIRFTKSDGSTLLDYYIEEVLREFVDNGTSSPLYPTLINPCAYYYNGKTYVTYQGFSMDPYVTALTNITKFWAVPRKVAVSPLSGDDHGVPALIVNSIGKILVAFGCHNSAMKCSISTNPEDINTWTARPDITPYATYPSFIKDSSNNIYIFYRGNIGGSLLSYCYSFRKSTDNGLTWSAETTIINMSGVNALYAGKLEYDSVNGRIHIPLVYHDGAVKHNLYHVYLDLSDNHVYTMEGVDLGVQATKAELDANALVINTGVYVCSFPSLALDSNGYPHIINVIEDGTGIHWKYVFWNGLVWSSPQNIADSATVDVVGDILVNAPNNIICYITISTVGQGGDLHRYSFNGSIWTLEESFERDPYLNGTDFVFHQPHLVENYADGIKWIFSSHTNGGYGDYTKSDKSVFALDENNKFVNRLGKNGTAKIDVKIDSIPADPATIDIYLYYGKGSAVNLSNGQNTMLACDDGIANNFDLDSAGTATISRTNLKTWFSENSIDDGFALAKLFSGWNKWSTIRNVAMIDTGSGTADQLLFLLLDIANTADICDTAAIAGPNIRFGITRYLNAGTYPNYIIVVYRDIGGIIYYWTGTAWSISVQRIPTLGGTLEFRIWDDGINFYADVLDINGVSVFGSVPTIAISSVKGFSNGKVIGLGEIYTDTDYIDGFFRTYFSRDYVFPEPTFTGIGTEEATGPSTLELMRHRKWFYGGLFRGCYLGE